MKQKWKIILINIIILGGVCNMFFDPVLPTDEYGIEEYLITEDTIVINGFITHSGKKFIKYTYKFADGNLYVKIYGSMITPFDTHGVNTSGRFDIEIDKHQFGEEIETIYFQGFTRRDIKQKAIITVKLDM